MIIVNKRIGQLGNVLFQFSTLIAHSIEYGYKLYNFNFIEFQPLFENTRNTHIISRTKVRIRIFNQPLTKLTRKIQRNILPVLIKKRILKEYHNTNGLDPILDLSEKSIVLSLQKEKWVFNGWWYSDKECFEKNADNIRTIFKPATKFTPTLERFKNEGITFKKIIGLHIRQGDYATWKEGIYNYSTEQYIAILNRLFEQEKFDKSEVLVFVSSKDKIDVSLFHEFKVYYQPTNHFIEDLYSLSLCDLIIGPPSTFSAWASFYGNKPLIQVVNPEYFQQINPKQIITYVEPNTYYFANKTVSKI